MQLIYGNKSPEETMYQDQLIELQEQYKDRLKSTGFTPKVTNQTPLWSHRRGHCKIWLKTM